MKFAWIISKIEEVIIFPFGVMVKLTGEWERHFQTVGVCLYSNQQAKKEGKETTIKQILLFQIHKKCYFMYHNDGISGPEWFSSFYLSERGYTATKEGSKRNITVYKKNK